MKNKKRKIVCLTIEDRCKIINKINIMKTLHWNIQLNTERFRDVLKNRRKFFCSLSVILTIKGEGDYKHSDFSQ